MTTFVRSQAPSLLLARDEIRDSLGSRIDVGLGCLLGGIDVWLGCIDGLVGKVLSLVNIGLACAFGRVCVRRGDIGEFLGGGFAVTYAVVSQVKHETESEFTHQAGERLQPCHLQK